MRTPTKLAVIAGASLLGVALAVGGASAAVGSLTTTDFPGQVLQVSGVDVSSGRASATATQRPSATATQRPSAAAAARANINANAKGPSVATAKPKTAGTCCVAQVPRAAPQTLPTHHTEMPWSGGDHHMTWPSGSGHDTMR